MNEQAIPNNRFEQGFTLIELLIVVLLTIIVIIGLYDLFDANVKIYKTQEETTTMDVRTRTAMEQMVTSIRSAGSNYQNTLFMDSNPFIVTAQSNKIRVLEDLPKDVVSASGDGASGCSGGSPDGDSFDICDLNNDGSYSGDNENENGDGYINDDYEDVMFILNGTNVERTQFEDSTYDPSGTVACIGCDTKPKHATVTDIIATNIESLTFEYFQDTVTQLTAPVTGNDLYNIHMVRVTMNARTASKDLPTGQPHRLQLKSDIYLRNSN